MFALSTADDPRSWPNATERLRGSAHRVSLRSRATLSSGRVAIPFSTYPHPFLPHGVSRSPCPDATPRRAASRSRSCLTFVPLGSHYRVRKREKGSGCRLHFDFSELSCAMDEDKRMRWDCDRKLSPKVATTDFLIQLMYGNGAFGRVAIKFKSRRTKRTSFYTERTSEPVEIEKSDLFLLRSAVFK